MFKQFIGAAVFALAPFAAQASTINLADRDLIPQTPVYSGAGDLEFQGGRVNVLSDNTNVKLDGFADSQLLLTFSDTLANLISISYDANNAEQFDVTAIGDNGDDTFEMLLERSSFRFSGPSLGLGPNAIIRFTSDGFDFSQETPFSFFASNPDPDYFGVEFTATSLFAVPMAVVPLSPGLLFLITGIAGLGLTRLRKAMS